MQADGDGAGMGNFFEPDAGGLIGHWAGLKCDIDLNPGNAPGGLCGHYLCYVEGTARQFNAVALGKNGHCGDDARAECVGYQVSRRESFTPALIVGRGVGIDVGSRLKVSAIGTQITNVVNVNGSHVFG